MSLPNAKEAKVLSLAVLEARIKIDLDKIMEMADRVIKNDQGTMTGSIDVRPFKDPSIKEAAATLQAAGYSTNVEVGDNYKHLVIWWNHV